ncbi:MAG: sigma-70 family RNA polymerase sigma factor [Planctomycetota bacterium]
MVPSESDSDPPEIARMLERLATGDDSVWPELLRMYDGYLHRLLSARLDTRLNRRFDMLDLIQETHLQLTRRIQDYLERRPMPFKLWVRATACQCVMQQYRKHVQAQARSVGREQHATDQSSVLLARQLIDSMTSPSGKAANREESERVMQAVGNLSESDREVLLLRTYEGLTNAEASRVLEIEQDACRKRYTRALLRLRESMRVDPDTH